MLAHSLKSHTDRPRHFDEVGAVFDICFIINVNSRGWILEKICRIIEESSGAVCCFLFSERNDRLSAPLPKARNYMFAHFSLCYFTMLNHPEVLSGSCHVWYTHPDLQKGMTQQDIVDMVDLCTHVFTPCSVNRDTLLDWGARGDNISVPLGGADPSAFVSEPRTGSGAVGFVGAYYPRKQPEKMLEIARLMPDQKILLLGPRPQDVENTGILWHNWPDLTAFMALPNVEYVEADYSEFADWYRKFDVYCSTSLLEGGPIPAIEAMMSNVIPVISDTGFARDIIDHGKTGYVFPTSADPDEIVALIRTALADTQTDIAAHAAAFSWADFGRHIWQTMRGTPQLGEQIDLEHHENAVRYLVRGFHPPEIRGVWTRAQVAQIALPIPDGVPPETVSLRAWAPPEALHRPLNVHVRINGFDAGEHAIGTSVGTHTFAITPAMIAKGDTLAITMMADTVYSAKDRPDASREKRLLGMKIGWIRLD